MLVVTLGDPYSINIEMLAPILAADEDLPWPLVVCGSWWQWQDQTQRAAVPALSWQRASGLQAVSAAGGGRWFVDCAAPAVPERRAESLSSLQRGQLARASLECLQGYEPAPGQRLAVLTAPIEKYAARQAGFPYPGQTEYFADLWQAEAIMLLAGPQLKVGLATNHTPLAEVAAAITAPLLARKLQLLARSLQEVYHLPCPRIAVCGLNPHAGEGGLCGRQEEDLIKPCLAELRQIMAGQAIIAGPLPADTVFWQASQGEWDGVLALYHDQGLGPLKTLHFDNAVNISGGLPHLRVSPDHGPARDAFLTGRASPRSFAAAWELAKDYLGRRR